MSQTSAPTLGWSSFGLGHSTKAKGNSYSKLSDEDVVALVREHWGSCIPGDGETDRNRKVLVRVPAKDFFCPPTAKLVEGLPVQCEVTRRQDGEELHVETFVTPEDADRCGALVELPADFVEVVCYSAAALEENDGERSTDCEWEIVCLLCTKGYKSEPMHPLTMARNQLEQAGGTSSTYTGKQFAEAIWHWRIRKGVKVRAAK
jgi:hypothetical protein